MGRAAAQSFVGRASPYGGPRAARPGSANEAAYACACLLRFGSHLGLWSAVLARHREGCPALPAVLTVVGLIAAAAINAELAAEDVKARGRRHAREDDPQCGV